jgi:O-antigen/teichoic acid export membrane protein
MVERVRVLQDPSPQPTTPPSGKGDAAHRKIQAHEIAVAVRNGMKLGGSLIVTWSVALIVKLQIPAHLGPVRQGHFAFAESFAGMFFAAISFGVDTYVMKEVSVRQEHASDFLGGVFALRALISVVLFAAMAFTLWATGRSPEIQFAVVVFGFTQFLMCINQTLATLLQAATNIGRLAVANVLAKFIWGGGLLLALHYGAPLYALAMPMLASELLRTAFLVPAATVAAQLRYRIDLGALRAVLIASVPFFISALAVTFGGNLAMSALEFIRKDEREVGWFAASQNIGSLAMLLHPVLTWVVMPMLSRAQARSGQEMMQLLRRSIEALVVLIAPIMTMISAGSDIFIRIAFGQRYLPAALGLSILSLVFLMIYLSILVSSALTIAGKSWSVTVISSGAVLIMAGLIIVFVPLGRALFGTGGECAGAAMAVIANEAFIVIAMLSRFRFAPFDRRNVSALIKATGISACVLVVNHLWHNLGAPRLLLDAALYLVLALVARLVSVTDVQRVVGVLRSRRQPAAAT